MAPARRQTNGRSPLVNKQSQITFFFNKFAESSSVLPPPSIPLKEAPGRSPAADKSPSPSDSPTTPSPLQPKRKKPLLTIPSTASPSTKSRSYGSPVVGKRVRVYWPLDEVWYEGSVTSYDEKSDRHVVVYDDGEEEALELAKEKIEWVEETVKKFKRLRHGGSAGKAETVVGLFDGVAVEEGVEEDDEDDEDDEDWGKGKVVEEDSDDDCDDMELVDDEDSDVAVGRERGKARSRKRKVQDVKVEDSGRKKCSSSSGREVKAEVCVSRLNVNKGSKLNGQ